MNVPFMPLAWILITCLATFGVPVGLLLYASTASAETYAKVFRLAPGDIARVRVECASGDCPEPVVSAPYGKAHGAWHTKAGGYEACADCHDATLSNTRGALDPKWTHGSLCPSQGPHFAPAGLLVRLGLTLPTALGQTIMTADGPARDPYTGATLPVVGDRMALYVPGESARCIDCHNHHGQDGQIIKPEAIGWKKEMIKEGCLHCHTAVGRSDLRSEIKALLSGD